MTTFHELYQSIKSDFRKIDSIDTPDLDARVLICDCAGFDHAAFITSAHKPVPKAIAENIYNASKRRTQGEPVSKIIGRREFWGMDFIVTPDTLSPRPETEIIIEQALDWLSSEGLIDAPIRILDLGTGTGCIPIALLSELPNATAIAADLSGAALNVARQNAEKYKMMDRLSFLESNWFEVLEGESFDLITSNPPYIEESSRESLPVEVLNHDPDLALFGGVLGLDPYKIIFTQLNSHLNEAGRAFFEIGQNQLEGITRLVDDSNLTLCDSVADLAGIPRVVEICRGDK